MYIRYAMTRCPTRVVCSFIYILSLALQVLRYASLVTSEAHLAVMQHTRPGMVEFQLESLFCHWCYYYGGCRFVSRSSAIACDWGCLFVRLP